MDETDEGTTSEVKPEQESNAQSLISVTDCGILIFVKPVHKAKDPMPMVLTELPMVTVDRFSQ